jgi:hypothetical protein
MKEVKAREGKFSSILWGVLFIIALNTGCSTTTTSISRRQAEPPRGYFQGLLDQLSERECNVGRFICPYGLGPAGEPCECTDPNGVVVKGLTVK